MQGRCGVRILEEFWHGNEMYDIGYHHALAFVDKIKEDIEKLKNFAEDKGINDIINILFAIDNKIYEIEEKSKAEDTDFDESKVNRDEKGRFAAKNSSANTESEQESSRK